MSCCTCRTEPFQLPDSASVGRQKPQRLHLVCRWTRQWSTMATVSAISPVKSTRMIGAVRRCGLIDVNVTSSVGARRGFTVGPKTKLDNMPNLRALTLAALYAEKGFVSIRRDPVAEMLPETGFNLVRARLVLEHLSGRDEIVRRLARTLKPGGRLLMESVDSTVCSCANRACANSSYPGAGTAQPCRLAASG